MPNAELTGPRKKEKHSLNRTASTDLSARLRSNVTLSFILHLWHHALSFPLNTATLEGSFSRLQHTLLSVRVRVLTRFGEEERDDFLVALAAHIGCSMDY